MADNVQVTQGVGTTMATDDVGGVQYPRVKVSVGPDGSATDVSSSNPMPVNDADSEALLSSIDAKTPALSGGRVPVELAGAIEIANDSGSPIPVSGTVTANTGLVQPLTNAELRATAVPVSGPLTDTQLRATPVPVSGTVTANTGLAQPLTDTQLRAIPVPVSGTVTANTGLSQPLTDAQLRATPVPVSGTVTANTGLAQPLTNSELRASAVPVSGPLTDTELRASAVPVTGPLTDAQLRASSVPVSVASLPLPSGAATESTLASLNVKFPAKGLGNTIPSHSDEYVNVRPLPQVKFRTTFARTIATGVDSSFFNLLQTGSGQAVSQSGGNLVLTSGTTTNSETIIRSVRSFADSLTFRWSSQLSQRIVNQQFFVELVDVIGDDLAVTVNSATSITVTIPSNPFDSQNVGQSVYIGRISGIAGAVPGRYAIASVSGNNVNFTVAGWPASGSGTLSLFGWNYHQVVYSGTTVTNTLYDAQRRGWASGATTATINTTAAPGHVGIISSDDGVAAFLDSVAASSTALQTTMRASRVQNIPAQETELFIQLRVVNGTTAPASSTTWTVGFVVCENYAPQAVTLNGVKPQAFNASMPVSILNTPTVTANIGTGSLAAGTNAIGDVGLQYRASSTGAASGAHIVSAATTNATIVKGSAGRLLGWSLGNTNAAWRYVKFHNQATLPTAGTGVVRTIAIPPNGRAELIIEGGIAFATGIGLTTVTGAADADTTAVGLNDIVGDVFFA